LIYISSRLKYAFLNGPIDEVVFVTQPPGFVIEWRQDMVYRLHKAFYGLKQAPRAWNNKIDSYLLGLGFTKCKSEYGAYVQDVTYDITLICLYVDDLLVTGNIINNMKKFKQLMMKEFKMENLINLSYFLDMEFIRIEKGIIVHERMYNREVLKRFKMFESNPATSPVEANLKLDEAKVDATLSK